MENNRDQKKHLLGVFLILISTIIWGSSFIVLKQAISTLPTFFVITFRFSIAGVILFLGSFRRIIKSSKKTILRGIVLGVILALAYFFQTLGLVYTTASKNAFLTAVYVIFCPFLLWVGFKKKIKIYNILAAVVCIVGVFLVTYSSEDETGGNQWIGDILTIISGLFYAFQMIFIGKYNDEHEDPRCMLAIEVFTVAVIFSLLTLCYELPKYGSGAFKIEGDAWWRLVYLAIVCTLFTQTGQLIGQKYATPEETSIILSLEAVFGTLFSVLLGDEKLTPFLICGFVVLFFAIILSERGDSICKRLEKFKNKRKEKIENTETHETREDEENVEDENKPKEE